MFADYTWLEGNSSTARRFADGDRKIGLVSGRVLNTSRQHAGAVSEAPRGGGTAV
jgi:hypothetical protein